MKTYLLKTVKLLLILIGYCLFITIVYLTLLALKIFVPKTKDDLYFLVLIGPILGAAFSFFYIRMLKKTKLFSNSKDEITDSA